MTPVVAAWAVHLYTAVGAVVGFFALVASAVGNFRLAFAWLAVATFIDATDGSLARWARVKEVLPRFDGAKLDDIVDYLNYVVVPIVLAAQAGLLPQGAAGLAVGAAPLLASGYGFCHTEAKTADHFFTGFPSYWNIVVFYCFVLATPIWMNTLLLLVLAAMVFVPIRYLYPSRNPTAQRTTHVLGVLWALCIAVLLLQIPRPSRVLACLSLYFPFYYLAVSLHVHFRDRHAAGRGAVH
ncbi:MAG: CDP-alcohol phosphatidyltransferase family protein [Candidatus Binatia bacterium]